MGRYVTQFDFDIFFDLASGSLGSLNNMVGAGISADCDKELQATIQSASIIVDAADAATSAAYTTAFAKASGALGILSVAVKVANDEPLTLGDYASAIGSVLSIAGRFSPIGFGLSAFSFGYTFFALGEDGYPTNPDHPACGRPKTPDFSDAEANASPIVIDLNGDGIKTTPLAESRTKFDLNNNQFAEKTAWVDKNDGLLALDLNGNGRIDNGSELFGNHTALADGSMATDGYAALAQYDDNGDGVIDSRDKIYEQLRVWLDANSNGYTDAGELKTLEQVGITSIDTQFTKVNERDGSGNLITHRGNASMADGSSAKVADVWFNVNPTRTRYIGEVEISEEVAELPNVRAFGNVYDLHIAMMKDAALKEVVEGYIAASAEERPALLEQLIYRWTGSDNIDSHSRGDNVDARKLVALEHLVGKDYHQGNYWRSNPGPNAGKILDDEFAKFATYVQGALLLNTDAFQGAKLYADKLDLAIRTGADLNLLQQEFGEYLLTLAKSDNIAQARYEYQLVHDLFIYSPNTQESISRHFLEHTNKYLDLFINGIGPARTKGDDQDNTLLGHSAIEGLKGSGNDVLEGGAGSDTYVFIKNFGKDLIKNHDTSDNRHDEIRFLDGIKQSDFTYHRYGNDLYLTAKNGRDELIVQNYFIEDGKGGYQIDDIIFSDGVTLTVDDIKILVQQSTEWSDELHAYAEGNTLSGLAGDDALFGYAGDDNLDGGIGNDVIIAGGGDDILRGGLGNDHLTGGEGNDTYIFNPGFGQDVVINLNEDSAYSDVIVFEPKEGHEAEAQQYGMNSEHFVFTRDGSDLIIQHKDSSDQITVQGYFEQDGQGKYGLDIIRFADGTEYDFEKVKEALRKGTPQADKLYGYSSDDTLDGGDGNDTLYGYDGNDTLKGGAGDDTLEGGAGNDVLDGGKGHDTLIGGIGDDTYTYNLGDGNDIITNADDESNGTDVLQLNDIQPDQVRATRSNKALLLHLADGAIITVTDYFDGSDVSSNAIEQIRFADGSAWNIDQVKQYVQQPSEQDDTLYGYDEADSLNGQGGHDNILGYGGNDTLNGGEGNDYIDGGNGNDHITGGKGDDTLVGGAGNDIYHYNAGDGNDIIHNTDESGGSDTLALHGISKNDIRASRNNSDLILTYTNGETITVTNYFDQHGTRSDALAAITFDDGSILDTNAVKTLVQQNSAQNDKLYGYDGDDTLDGAGGDDIIYGYDSNDVLNGGEGNDSIDGGNGDDTLRGGEDDDTLRGGAGNDTYIYRHGDGNDIIYNAANLKDDQDILLLENIKAASIRPTRYNNDLILHLDNGQTITLKQYFIDDANGKDTLSTIRFADGSEWDIETVKTLVQQSTPQTDTLYGYAVDDTLDGGAGDDTLYGRNGDDTLRGGEGSDRLYGENGDDQLFGGRGADQLEGGEGNDHLEGGSGDDILSGGKGDDNLLGGSGNDVYRFKAGDGHDTIVAEQLADYETNTLRLQNVAPETVNFKQSGSDLLIVLNATQDSIRVEGYFAEDTNKRGIDRIVFDDDKVLQHADIAKRTLHETEGDDVLVGSPYDDVIDGKGGNDEITGGQGDDTLIGGSGDDIYHYNLGDGHDTIIDKIGTDAIVFGDNIRIEDVNFSRTGSHLLISVAGEPALTLNDWFSDETNRIEYFRFTDGSELNIDDLKSMNIHSQFGKEDDIIIGWDGIETIDGGAGHDTITGGDGDDHLIGGKGNDHLDGGNGADTLEGGAGDDIYRIDSADSIIERANEGYDTVETSDSFDLNGTEIEAVTLLGDDDTEALGNDADNRLTGNSGNNRLDGRGGADIMQGGKGDDYYIVDRYDNVEQDSDWSGYLVAGDKVIEEADSGIDTIERSADLFIITRDELGNPINSGQYADLEANVENLVLTGNAVSAYGNALDNDIVLNEADNIVHGRGGNDTIHYSIGGGKDTMHFLDNVTAKDTLHISGINDEQATVRREGDSIIIGFAGHEEDQIILKDYFKDGSTNGESTFDHKVDKVIFDANGREWDQAYLEYLAQGGNHSTAPIANNNSVIEAIEAESLNVNLNDYFSDREGDTLSFMVTTADGSALPEWLHIDSQTGIISGRPPLGTQDLQLNVTASEASSLSVSSTLTMVVNDNQAPVMLQSPNDISTTEAVAFNVNLANNLFSDPEGHELSYELTTADGSELPEWLHFDAETLSINGKPPANIDKIDLRLRAIDAAGLHSDTSFDILIAPNQSPVLSEPYENILVNEGDTFSKVLDLNRFRDPENGKLNIELSQADGQDLPSWLTFNTETGLISGIAPKGQSILNLKIQARDEAGYITSDYFGFNVNAAPELSQTIETQAVEEGDTWRYTLPENLFIDPEGDDLAYNIGFEDGSSLPTWMHYDQETRTISADVPIGQESFDLNITAIDSNGLSADTKVNVDVTHTDLQLEAPWNGGSLKGKSGDDVLKGSWYNDTLEGGKGNDLLQGSIGSDTYRFNKGDGQDIIDDAGGLNDKLVLNGYSLNDVSIERQGNDQILHFADGNDSILIKDRFTGANRGRMEHIDIEGRTMSYQEFESSVQTYSASTAMNRAVNADNSALQAQSLVSAMAAFGAGEEVDKLQMPDSQQPLLIANSSNTVF